MDPASPFPDPSSAPRPSALDPDGKHHLSRTAPSVPSDPALKEFASPVFDEVNEPGIERHGPPASEGFDSPLYDESSPAPVPVDSVDDARSGSPSRLPGPGLPESLGWLMGVFMVQVFASAAMSVVAVVVMFIRQGPQPPEQFTESLKSLMSMSGVEGAILIVGSQVIFALAAVVAAWLRLYPSAVRRLSLYPAPWRHAAALFLAILPVSLMCGELYRVSQAVWDALAEHVTFLKLLDGINVMAQMEKIVDGIPVPLLFLAIAVVPAIAEELVFRGIIGRGLVARWGVPIGVLFTSLLFAVAHMHPVHVFAVVPLGIFMHIAYLSTRSFWAPMALHFVNNSMATVGLLLQKHSAEMVRNNPAARVLTEETAPSAELLVTAALASLAIFVFLWRTRVEYVSDDGTVWSPGYTTVEVPPSELGFERRCRRAPPAITIVAAACLLAFAAVFVQGLLREAEKAEPEEDPANATSIELDHIPFSRGPERARELPPA